MRSLQVTKLLLILVVRCDAFHVNGFTRTSGQAPSSKLSVASVDYLSTLSGGSVAAQQYASASPPAPAASTGAAPAATSEDEAVVFSHAPLSYFDIDKLTPKGPRSNADVGAPHDSTRKLTSLGSISSGSWWCAAGGWPSPALRATTEIFYVLSGWGCVTDLDNSRHFFGPGDTVVLPKGWSGRWDVLQDIHKIWFVYDHPNVEETSSPIRAVVSSYPGLCAPHLQTQEPGSVGEPQTASSDIYKVGPTQVGCWNSAPGSFPLSTNRVGGFHLMEGVLVLTNGSTGAAQRCVAGDTVMLPQNWQGHVDVIEPVRQLRVLVG